MEYFKKCLIKSGEASYLVKNLSLVSETHRNTKTLYNIAQINLLWNYL